jgi:hypothetical protein
MFRIVIITLIYHRHKPTYHHSRFSHPSNNWQRAENDESPMMEVFAVTTPVLKLTPLIIAMAAAAVRFVTEGPFERSDAKPKCSLVVAQAQRRPCHSYCYHRRAAGCPDKRLHCGVRISQHSEANKLILARAYHELRTAPATSTQITFHTSPFPDFSQQ